MNQAREVSLTNCALLTTDYIQSRKGPYNKRAFRHPYGQPRAHTPAQAFSSPLTHPNGNVLPPEFVLSFMFPSDEVEELRNQHVHTLNAFRPTYIPKSVRLEKLGHHYLRILAKVAAKGTLVKPPYSADKQSLIDDYSIRRVDE